jgi:hypothetical protein
MQKRQSILQRYGKPKCNYEQAGSLIGLDVGVKTGVRGIGRYRASDYKKLGINLRPGITGPATLKYRLEDEMISEYVAGCLGLSVLRGYGGQILGSII